MDLSEIDESCERGNYEKFALQYEQLEKTGLIPIGTILRFMRSTKVQLNPETQNYIKIQRFLRDKLYRFNGVIDLRRVALVHMADVNLSCKGYSDLLLYRHFINLSRANKPFDETAIFILQCNCFLNIENYVKFGLIGPNHTMSDIISDTDYIKVNTYINTYIKQYYVEHLAKVGIVKDIAIIVYNYL